MLIIGSHLQTNVIIYETENIEHCVERGTGGGLNNKRTRACFQNQRETGFCSPIP